MSRRRSFVVWIACATVVVACATPTREQPAPRTPSTLANAPAREQPPIECEPPSCPDGFRSHADGCIWTETDDEAIAGEHELYEEVARQVHEDFARARARVTSSTSFPQFLKHFGDLKRAFRAADFELEFFVESCRSPELVRGALERQSTMRRELVAAVERTTHSPALPSLPHPSHPLYPRAQAVRQHVADAWTDFRDTERKRALDEAHRREAVAKALAQRLLLVPIPANPSTSESSDAETSTSELVRSLADPHRPGCSRDTHARRDAQRGLEPVTTAARILQWYVRAAGPP